MRNEPACQSHSHGGCEGKEEWTDSEFDDETLMSFPFDIILASNAELAESFNRASEEVQLEIRQLWAVRNSNALRKLLEADDEDDESLPDAAEGSQIPDQFDFDKEEDPPAAPPGADHPEVLDLEDGSEREDSVDRGAMMKKKKKVLKTRSERVESADNSENSEEEVPLKVAHVKPGNKTRTPGAGYFRKSAVVAVHTSDKELRDACAKWKTNCYTAEAREQLGAVGVIQATHPSGCVSVLFRNKQKIKLPPNAMRLFCGPVRGPVMSSDLELKTAAEIIDALRSEDGIWSTPEFLEPDEAKLACRDAVNLCSEEDKMIMGGTGQGETRKRDGTLRGDFIRWMPKQRSFDGYDNTVPEGIDLLLCKLHRLRKALAYLLEKPLYRTSIQLAKYPGDMKGYVRHRDVKLGYKEPERRRITVTYYCNEGWKEEHGGEFVLYPKTRDPRLVARSSDSAAEKERKQTESFSVAKKFLPTANSLAVFQSHTYHEVLPMNKPRVAFAFWMYGPQSLGLRYPGSEGDQVDEDAREEVKP